MALYCPACGHSFESDDLEFCPIDGTKLIPPPEVKRIDLVGPRGRKLRPDSSPYVLDRRTCTLRYGEAGRVVARKGQFELRKRDERTWVVRPLPGTTNGSFLNADILTEETVLKDGDELGVGNAVTGKIAFTLKVGLVYENE